MAEKCEKCGSDENVMEFHFGQNTLYLCKNCYNKVVSWIVGKSKIVPK